MSTDLIVTLALLGVCVICFVVNKPRMDFVALAALLALPVLGVIDVQKAFAGFSDQSIILIALMFIIGECLERTGISSTAGREIVKLAGDNPTKLLVLLMFAVGIIGSIMSSTGIVALFIPVVLNICRKTNLSPSKLMMPLAVAGGVSGMMTLVATPPNMIASAALEREGFEALGFFDFTPIGFLILVFCTGYMFFAKRLLKGRDDKKNDSEDGAVPAQETNFNNLMARYKLEEKAAVLVVNSDSQICGKKIFELNFRSEYSASIVCVARRRGINNKFIFPNGELELLANDALLVDFSKKETKEAAYAQAAQMGENLGMTAENVRNSRYFAKLNEEHGLVEVIIPQGSRLVGSTIADQNFSRRYGMNIIGIMRGDKVYSKDFTHFEMKIGDTLLLSGLWSTVDGFEIFKRDMVLLTLPEESKGALAAPGRAPLALIALVVMLGLMISGVVANALAALAGCLLLIVFGCIDMNRVYRCINWPTLALIVGMYPFATALEDSGGIKLAVASITGLLGGSSPHLWLFAIMLLTSIVGLFISNTVVAILLIPVAINIAVGIGVSPVPFAIGVAITCSASFITPVSTPVNTLVMGPGRYKFFDFVKNGAPLAFLVIVISTFLIPALFPFDKNVNPKNAAADVPAETVPAGESVVVCSMNS